ncbi:TPA: tetracycline resistance ribosomal protection protein Tet(S), partial [Enterococcus faecium]|nr:tetracycline resistance ribosomal protection protein Tet(S) [Enterococcus faecium]
PEQWETVIVGNDYLLEKYTIGKTLNIAELEKEENERIQSCSLYPVYHGSAKNNIGIKQLIEVITSKLFSPTQLNSDKLCGNVFKVEYSDDGQRLVYVRLYSGTLHLRDSVNISEKEKIKVTEMYTSINGELRQIDKAEPGEIIILKNELLKLNNVLGDKKRLPHREILENPLPMLQTTIEPCKSVQREKLLDALFEISDSDPLLQYYV